MKLAIIRLRELRDKVARGNALPRPTPPSSVNENLPQMMAQFDLSMKSGDDEAADDNKTVSRIKQYRSLEDAKRIFEVYCDGCDLKSYRRCKNDWVCFFDNQPLTLKCRLLSADCERWHET